MTIQNIPLFQAMGAKMSYLDRRQGVLAQNIANADTPDYRPRDLTKVDFGTILQDVTKSNKVHLETTNPMHLPPPNHLETAKDRKSKVTYEVAPDGNSVIIEEQMVKATQTTMDFNLLTNLMSKNVGMIKTALGRGQ